MECEGKDEEYHTESEGDELLVSGSNQIPKKRHHYKQNFVEKWKKEFCWLELSKKDKHYGYCKACKNDINISAGKNALSRHEIREKHLSAVKALKKQRVLNFTSTSMGMHEKVASAEIRLAGFIAEHNISIRATDHMTKLFRSMFPDSEIAKQVTCGRTKTTAVINNVIGVTTMETTINLLRTNKFSLIIDESTDISSVKVLVLVVRVFHAGRVNDLFYESINVPNADSLSLYNAIKASFIANKIPYVDNLIGFASDGANVMMGRNNSVSVLLKRDVPHLFLMKCLCHSFNLCCSYACQKLPDSVEHFVNDVYNYFKKSYKRIAEYQKFQDFLNLKPPKMLYANQTRWLSLKQVVDRVSEQYDALKLFFTSESFDCNNDNKAKCTEILNHFKNPCTLLYLHFLQFMLPFFTNLNLVMQAERPKIHKIKSEFVKIVSTIMDFYLKKQCISEPMDKVEYKNPRNFKSLENVYFGANVTATLCKAQSELSEMEINKFKIDCLNFYIQSLDEIFKRFDFSDATFDLLQYLDPSKMKKDDIQSLAPLVVKFPNIVEEKSYQDLDNEFRMFRNELEISETTNIEDFWVSISKVQKGDDTLAYPHLSKLMLTLLSLPHSSATCERVFSQINLNKTKIRNKLSTETLSGIIRTKQHIAKNECHDFRIDSLMIKSMNKNMYMKKNTI